jgi:alkylated DNA repair protein (DNA oxidative demethylase)
LRGFCVAEVARLLEQVRAIEAASPFRRMTTRQGGSLSVAMTNCGGTGWVSDRSGYRYDAIDPLTGRPWPAMPAGFAALAARASVACGYAALRPEACLVNRYAPGNRLSLHQDRDDLDEVAPIVSVSLGLPATFLFGGLARCDPVLRFRLESGDVVVWGGGSRLAFHGVATVPAGEHPLTGACRINLTFRSVRALSLLPDWEDKGAPARPTPPRSGTDR